MLSKHVARQFLLQTSRWPLLTFLHFPVEVAQSIWPAIVAARTQILTADNLPQYNLQQLLPPDEQWIIRRELLQKKADGNS